MPSVGCIDVLVLAILLVALPMASFPRKPGLPKKWTKHAPSGGRTHDLILTKDTPYHLAMEASTTESNRQIRLHVCHFSRFVYTNTMQTLFVKATPLLSDTCPARAARVGRAAQMLHKSGTALTQLRSKP